MAIVINPSSGTLSGKVGDKVYYSQSGRSLARTAKNSSNFGASASRTTAQQTQRVKWGNLVNFSKISKEWWPKSFENLPKGVSVYNRFMGLNVSNSSVSLTKNEVAAGGCVVEPWIISQGSLYPVAWNRSTDYSFTSNIALGGAGVSMDTTTIADFSNALTSANTWLKMGMQITFVCYAQLSDPFGIPRVSCNYWEITLDAADTRTLGAMLPNIVLDIDNDFLVWNVSNFGACCFGIIISQRSGGRLLVSSQRLVNNNASMILKYSEESQRNDAIASYGQSADVFLTPGYQSDATQESALSIVEFSALRGTYRGTRSYIDTGSVAAPVEIVSNKPIESVSNVVLRASYQNGATREYAVPASVTWNISGNTATAAAVTFTPAMTAGQKIFRIAATINGKAVSFGGPLPTASDWRADGE